MSTKNRWRVQVLGAVLTHDTEVHGKIDPFVVLKTLGQKWKTSVAIDQGKTPRWRHERMKLKVDGEVAAEDLLELKIKDKNDHGAKLIGKCKIKLGDILNAGGSS